MIPTPKEQTFFDGKYQVPSVWRCQIPKMLSGLSDILDQYFTWNKANEADRELTFFVNPQIMGEAYSLEVKEDGVLIEAGNYQGAVHAVATLISLCKTKTIELMKISDYPDLKIRGFLLDISRDKIPKMKTLKQLVDKLMLLKYNHLELYVEGFSLKLPAFPELPYDDPLTLIEFVELQEYAQVRGIDLVPNINTFGHMTKWLSLSRYQDLAESPEGFLMEGYPFPPSTLNPCDPRSQELALKIVEDVIETSTSGYFNLNGDEPFELGSGKSKEACDLTSKGNVYLMHMRPLIEKVCNRGKRPLIWGDVLRNHLETIAALPEAAIVVDWGYDRDYDFNYLPAKLQGNHEFLLAPGTSSWNSFTGRFVDMKSSIDNAKRAAVKYGALGMLLTDWGDFSHPQPLVVSYPAIAYFADSAWSGVSDEAQVFAESDRLLFDCQEGYAKIIADLGKYNELEPFYLNNRTMTFASWMYVDKASDNPLALKQAIWKAALTKLDLGSQTEAIIRLVDDNLAKITGDDIEAQEIRQAALLVKASALLNQVASGMTSAIEKAKAIILEIRESYEKLWLRRNRSSGLKNSLKTLELLLAFLDNRT